MRGTLLMRRESELRQQAQEAIKGLIVRLSGWPDQSGDLLDIIDVLMQVDKKLLRLRTQKL